MVNQYVAQLMCVTARTHLLLIDGRMSERLPTKSE